MKTAMQELITQLREVQESAITDSFYNGLQSGIDKATELLEKEKEKEQIMAAYSDGLTKREYFAAMALQAVNLGSPIQKFEPPVIAARCVAIADALLHQLNTQSK